MREELLQLKLKCGESVWQKLGMMVLGAVQLDAEEYCDGLA